MIFSNLEKTNKQFQKLRIRNFDLHCYAINRSGKILAYLVAQMKSDYSRKKTLNNTDKQSFDRLITRFISRSMPYIISVINLENIFKDLAERIDELHSSIIGMKIGRIEELESTLSEEVSIYKFYRNKLYAHQAYIDPRGESETMKHTLMTYYSDGVLSISAEGNLVLGGACISSGDEEFNEYLESLKLPLKDKIPHIIDKEDNFIPQKLDIVKDNLNLCIHFSKWEHYVIGLLEKLIFVICS